VLTLVALWPFIEARLTGDHEEHNLLDRVWEHPVRTATGSALLAFFGILTLAGGNDVLSFYFGAQVETLTIVFRWATIALPIVVWIVAWRVCRARLRAEEERVEPPPPTGVALVRRPDGGFEEIEA
jgi:ubiquinol-cytochrome c reductase cytochrome b subunit